MISCFIFVYQKLNYLIIIDNNYLSFTLDLVIDSTSTVSYNHDSGEVETGTNSDTAVIETTTQIHVSERVNSDNGRDLHCTAESCSSLKELPNYSIFTRLASNCDHEKQSSLTEEYVCIAMSKYYNYY